MTCISGYEIMISQQNSVNISIKGLLQIGKLTSCFFALYLWTWKQMMFWRREKGRFVHLVYNRNRNKVKENQMISLKIITILWCLNTICMYLPLYFPTPLPPAQIWKQLPITIRLLPTSQIYIVMFCRKYKLDY